MAGTGAETLWAFRRYFHGATTARVYQRAFIPDRSAYGLREHGLVRLPHPRVRRPRIAEMGPDRLRMHASPGRRAHLLGEPFNAPARFVAKLIEPATERLC